MYIHGCACECECAVVPPCVGGNVVGLYQSINLRLRGIYQTTSKNLVGINDNLSQSQAVIEVCYWEPVKDPSIIFFSFRKQML